MEIAVQGLCCSIVHSADNRQRRMRAKKRISMSARIFAWQRLRCETPQRHACNPSGTTNNQKYYLSLRSTASCFSHLSNGHGPFRIFQIRARAAGV